MDEIRQLRDLMKRYLPFITTTTADVIRFVKLLIKMYQAGSTPKIPNGFVCSRQQRSVSINFLKWVDARSGDQKQCAVFRS